MNPPPVHVCLEYIFIAKIQAQKHAMIYLGSTSSSVTAMKAVRQENKGSGPSGENMWL